MSKILSDIEKLAAEVAKEALGCKDLEQKIIALKLLTPFYSVMRRTSVKIEDDEDTGPSMGDLQKKLYETETLSDRLASTTRRRRTDA